MRTNCAYNQRLSTQLHYYGLNHLHYLTKSTYRRARLYDSERFRSQWVATLRELRRELGFKMVGYVPMPEHFHALVWPTQEASPSQIMQKLEARTAVFIVKNLRMHNNPVKRGLVKGPGDWPWSSWRYYFLQDASLLAMDRVP